MKMSFNELRQLKDSLPDGSIHQIAAKLGVTDETVRNYFGGANYSKGDAVGIHFEPGPNGGFVQFEDTRILEMAQEMVASLPESV